MERKKEYITWGRQLVTYLICTTHNCPSVMTKKQINTNLNHKLHLYEALTTAKILSDVELDQS